MPKEFNLLNIIEKLIGAAFSLLVMAVVQSLSARKPIAQKSIAPMEFCPIPVRVRRNQ